MNNKQLNADLVEEIVYLIELLTKSGFFTKDEIIEILQDQFIEEEIDFTNYEISLNDFSNENFAKLEKVFVKLSKEGIVGIHNCGFDIKEGVEDAFELYIHLINNDFSPEGFCFYTFEDIEEAVFDGKLKITFGDFENNENKALEIGNIIFNYLIEESFSINWDGTVNNQIEINPFIWDKSFNFDREYEIEGAYECFVKNQVLE